MVKVIDQEDREWTVPSDHAEEIVAMGLGFMTPSALLLHKDVDFEQDCYRPVQRKHFIKAVHNRRTYVFDTHIQGEVENWMLNVLGARADKYYLDFATPEDLKSQVRINPTLVWPADEED